MKGCVYKRMLAKENNIELKLANRIYYDMKCLARSKYYVKTSSIYSVEHGKDFRECLNIRKELNELYDFGMKLDCTTKEYKTVFKENFEDGYKETYSELLKHYLRTGYNSLRYFGETPPNPLVNYI